MTRLSLVIALTLMPLAAAAQEPRVTPDPSITPGLAASADEGDVCSRDGGTYSQRHRLSQTPEVKRQVLARYGISWADRRDVEDDHLLPLCAGGADSVVNRWPQPRSGEWTASMKDELEAYACRHVCDLHSVSLAEAQSWFIAPADWRQAYCRYLGAGTPPCGELK